jgi:hypothetical protein
MILIDSDIIIWILRKKEDIKQKFISLSEQYEALIFITPIQIAEIYAGLKKKEKIDTEIFLNELLHLPIDKQVGQLAGEYLNLYSKSHSVTLADALIAASAKKNNLKIWTINKKHYPMFSEEEFVS